MRSVIILSTLLSAVAVLAAPSTKRDQSDSCAGLSGQATLSTDGPYSELFAVSQANTTPDALGRALALGAVSVANNITSYTLHTASSSDNSLGFALSNGGLITLLADYNAHNQAYGPLVSEIKDGQPVTFVSKTSTSTPLSAWCAVPANNEGWLYSLAVDGSASLFSLCPDGKGQSVLFYKVTGEAAQSCSAVKLLIAST